MVLNDFDSDIRVILAKEGLTKSRVAEIGGVQKQYITQMLKHKFVTDSLVNFMEWCGYDILVEFIKKEDKEED